MTIKAFIVGCGSIGGVRDLVRTKQGEVLCSHASAYTESTHFQLVGCSDTEESNARALADYYGGLNLYTDTKHGLNECEPDVVSICTPDHTHFTVLRDILSAGVLPKIIFLEKPAFLSEAELTDARSLVEQSGIRIVVNNSRRFHSLYKGLRSVIAKKTFGSPVRVDCWYYGGWLHNGIHIVDTLVFLFGQRLECKNVVHATPIGEQDWAVDAVFRVPKAKFEIHVHFFEETLYQLFEFDFKFTDARLRIENFDSNVLLETVEVNALRERVLQKADLSAFFVTENSLPIKHALDYIGRKVSDGGDCNAHGLESAALALHTLWDVKARINL